MTIKLSNISLKLNNKLVLDNLDLEINEHDRIGIVGPNGSGKTVLLRLLAGIYKNYHGNINYSKNFFFLSNPGVGAHHNLNLIDNIKRILAHYNVSKIDTDYLKKLIIDFEFCKYKDYEFIQLSQGYQIRVSIIIFFLLNFKNILIDEFLGFGDKFIVDKFYNKLCEKFTNLETLIVASHNENLIKKFCNRIIHLEKGKIIQDEKI